MNILPACPTKHLPALPNTCLPYQGTRDPSRTQDPSQAGPWAALPNTCLPYQGTQDPSRTRDPSRTQDPGYRNM